MKKWINYLDNSKWVVPVTLGTIAIFVIYFAYRLQELSVKNGYGDLTLWTVISFIMASIIYILSSSGNNNKIATNIKNILIITLASLSIFSVLKLKFQVYDLQNQITTIQKEIEVKMNIYPSLHVASKPLDLPIKRESKEINASIPKTVKSNHTELRELLMRGTQRKIISTVDQEKTTKGAK